MGYVAANRLAVILTCIILMDTNSIPHRGHPRPIPGAGSVHWRHEGLREVAPGLM
jgi:hypothetical protein